MATFVKSIGLMMQMFLLLVTLVCGEEVHLVNVEFELTHERGAGPFRLVGNTSVLGNGNPFDAPSMDATSSDYASLHVQLTAGETYSVNVLVDVCPCPSEPKIFKAIDAGKGEMRVWIGDKACNILCPCKSTQFHSIRSVV